MTTIGFVDAIAQLANVDLFERDPKTKTVKTGLFVGRPFHLDYDKASVLVADSWKDKAGGLPQGAFLLAYYENEDDVSETVLLRVLRPTSLPTDRDVISSMVEYYKDDLKTAGKDNQLDQYTRYEFSFSGLECRVLGTFYREINNRPRFGADLENFYSAHNYRVVKPSAPVLEYIVNFREGTDLAGKATDIRIGRVRYSSSRRFQAREVQVPVYVHPQDFLGKRTALFGMTRTGKSNTVKKIIQATVAMGEKAPYSLANPPQLSEAETLDPFTKQGFPKFPAGQIIFDINGEYANANMQDEGTAIFELYKDRVTRFSILDKPGFRVMKTNFYEDIEAGFEILTSLLEEDDTRFVQNFRAVDLAIPLEKKDDKSFLTRHSRRVVAYQSCLHAAGFKHGKQTIQFQGEARLNALSGLDPTKGISFDQAVYWFTSVWDAIGKGIDLGDNKEFFSEYKKEHDGREWADEDLKSLLVMLTRKRTPGGKNVDCNGYLVLKRALDLHTDSLEKPYAETILELLREGKIVIADLSQGEPTIIQLYSEKICQRIFNDAMSRFIQNRSNNFIQMYFEEAHNLFPKKEDKDLSQIYNRLAKEGAKLHIGLIYATQEVSSISSNILKNTQNWFVAHLNNTDELKEVEKYYDYEDFSQSLSRFSASTDKGFIRVKTYSNSFTVPIQVDRFAVK